jgi:1-acyl-sn-glycerol-3-phosphate acyltransferase
VHPAHPPTPARDGPVLLLPPALPRTRNAFTRWLGRTVLRLGGWRMVGQFPDLPRAVLIGVPHSSNWDGLWGFAAKLGLGLDIRILGKDSLFRVPLLGGTLRRLGVIPVDRSTPSGVVGQAADMIRRADKFWFGLAPEGTRRQMPRWRTGFWKIAKAAGVPIIPAYFHYPDRVIGVGPPFWPGEDMEADLRALRDWYRPWEGKHHGTS